ncbi:sensor histidine kinase [Actinomadura chibensis]|uniref:histidine kinase n=1 Tax=Actinomadura chibensis TaxID=392828 RepID=A0A5D0NM20_9ACTN|nr:ATP-binding protein [Actinomadura chibensis]TYB45502.1 sensor histidine kinase [Actinomadura chibensis]
MDEHGDDSVRPGHRALFAAGAALVAADAGLAVRWGTFGPLFYTKELAQIGAWLLAGFLVVRVRPGRPMGTLMLSLGLLLGCTAPAAFALVSGSAALRLLVAVSSWLNAFQLPLGAHVFLAYPTGRLRDAAGRRVVAGGYAFGAVNAVVIALFGMPRPDGRCRDVCAPLTPVHDPGLANVAGLALSAGGGVLAVVGGAVIVRRYRPAGWRERRVLAFPTVAMIVTAGLWTLVSVQGALLPWFSYPVFDGTLAVAQFVAVASIPAAFFMGLLRERLDEARVSDLVREIAELPPDLLEAKLAATLHDPGLRIAFPLDGGHVSADGTPAELPGPGDGAAITVIGDPADPVAVLSHDPSLHAEPRLLEAVTEATRLVLENTRLQVTARAHLAQVRALLARIVAAEDAARHRLQRDLHDGAQPQLVWVGLELARVRAAAARTVPAARRADLDKALDEAEARLRAALRSLRELSRGIHPAVLTTGGLRAALRELVRRADGPVRLHMERALRDLPQPIALTAYFVVSEALTNALRHAGADRVDVTADLADGRVTVRVADDGTGGAAARPGSGLAGLRDRVAAVDGVLDLRSEPGEGTVLTVVIPCPGRFARDPDAPPRDAVPEGDQLAQE